MSDSPIYLIPPYLLQTCLGLESQRELSRYDPILAETNIILPHLGQHYFRQPRHLPKLSSTFCSDPQVNLLIRKKLLEQFATLGILGSSPPQDVPDDYLYELYSTFKSRLANTRQDCDSVSAPDSTEHGAQEAKQIKSIFEIPRLGEVILGPSQLKNMTSALENYSLEALMEWVKESNEHKFSFLPYLMINGEKSFLTPFPMYWTPLAVDADLKYLDDTLGMDINLEDGYSNLDFRLSPGGFPYQNPTQKKRFFNFIANKEVEERTGIYYYEVSVEQTAEDVTDFKPLIHLDDTSISSGHSLFFSIGFTKRHVQIEKNPPPICVTASVPGTMHSVDLKALQSDISFYNQDASQKAFEPSTLKFMGSEPGVTLEGSFAVGFNNSCSYASTKSGADTLRSPANNVNRRFSQLGRHPETTQLSANLPLQVPRGNHANVKRGSGVYCKTDTLGCGVNFLEKTLIITLNGIYMKTISEEEIIASNVFGDSLFSKDGHNLPLFPIIGFQLEEFPSKTGTSGHSTTRISTNFGLREFKFNIDRYVNSQKAKQKLALEGAISGELQKAVENDEIKQGTNGSEFEKAVCNLRNDSTLLNDFISGYLVREGYLDTLSSLEADLQDLGKNLQGQPVDTDMSSQNGEVSQFQDSIERSAAKRRQKMKSLIFNAQYVEAGNYLRSEFSEFSEAETFVTKLNLLHYVALLQTFIWAKFDQGDLERSRTIAEEVVQFGKDAFPMPSEGEDSNAFGQLSSVLLINKKEQLAELPQARAWLETIGERASQLSNTINDAILKHMGYSVGSKLETMVYSAGQNVASLCQANDDMFKMVNYERDYIDF